MFMLHRFPAMLALFVMCCLWQVEAAAAPREGVLLVAFGTSVPEANVALTALDRDFRAAFPQAEVEWAYTSQIIRRKLAEQGRPVGSIGQGLASLARKGVRVVRVQSLHVLAGEEFSALERAVLLDVKAHTGRFDAVYFGRPLLDSRQDADEVIRAVLDSAASRRKPGEALVLMGHGQKHGRADVAFEGVRALFAEADPLVVMGSVEGSRGMDAVLADLARGKARRLWLQPFMVVAGDHARNDLAGDEEDSWASQLRARGYVVDSHLVGLGEIAGVRAVFVRHARESRDNLVKEPVKP